MWRICYWYEAEEAAIGVADEIRGELGDLCRCEGSSILVTLQIWKEHPKSRGLTRQVRKSKSFVTEAHPQVGARDRRCTRSGFKCNSKDGRFD